MILMLLLIYTPVIGYQRMPSMAFRSIITASSSSPLMSCQCSQQAALSGLGSRAPCSSTHSRCTPAHSDRPGAFFTPGGTPASWLALRAWPRMSKMLASRGDIMISTNTIRVECVGSFSCSCLLYTSDAADEEDSVDRGGGRILEKKKQEKQK
eukprot:TRINITY_DN26837_c0_g1_i1.p1 TRINITY_DN26837_c0_g1~~TRINITY_DN26837_c0_g1_i1.p1  ORF type:complete len:153 (-),score=13.62 TRINITY_DN26837_c0_g1_i1:32-490(-)